MPTEIPNKVKEYLEAAHKIGETLEPASPMEKRKKHPLFENDGGSIRLEEYKMIIVRKCIPTSPEKPFDVSVLQETKNISGGLYDEGVYIARTLDWRIHGAYPGAQWVVGYLLQDLAPGVDLQSFMYDNNGELRRQFANEPQEFFDKYIFHYMRLYQEYGFVDCNWTNLFYTSGKITFIDQGPMRPKYKPPALDYVKKRFIKCLPCRPDDKSIELIKTKMQNARPGRQV
jgi:hypothetical protein